MGADDLLTISPACFVASMDLVIIMIAVGSYVGESHGTEFSPDNLNSILLAPQAQDRLIETGIRSV